MTIILASGITRGWRSAWEVAAGVVAALVIIGVLIHSNQDLAETLGFIFVAAVVGIVGISLRRK